MKKLIAVFTILIFSVSADFVYAETFKATTSDGEDLSLTIVPRAYSASGGKSEIRVPGTWSYSKGSISLTNGVIYPLSWSNYEKESTGTLNDNDISQGAMMAIFYATPSTSCSGGAILTAIMEMPKATGMTNIGTEITMTPMNGFLCGTPISSFVTYTLKAITTATAFISGSKTTTGTGSTSLSSVDFTGSYKSEINMPGGVPTMSLTQTGTALTGTAIIGKITLTLTGTVSSGTASVKVVSSGTNCSGSGSGSGVMFYMSATKVAVDVKPDFTSTCGGSLFGTFAKQ
jgi:hypothetical protein